jgi:hypothetical protein
MKLAKHAFVIVDALRARHQMLVIKDNRRYASDAMLRPELLFLAHLSRKPLIGQKDCGPAQLRAYLDSARMDASEFRDPHRSPLGQWQAVDSR